MTKNRIKKLLDFIPLLILIGFSIYLLWTRVHEDILLTWRHWIALTLLLFSCYSFRRNHQLGALALGLTLLFGLLGIAQFSPGVSISYAYWTPFDAKIPVFYGQPIFLLWLIIHFVVSGRFYFAITTKGYWRNLFEDSKHSRSDAYSQRSMDL